MSKEHIKLWMKAFGYGELICPFPRLEVMRSSPDLITDREEYEALVLKEKAYYEERHKARLQFYELLRITPYNG